MPDQSTDLKGATEGENPPAKPACVVIVEDHAGSREAMKLLLARTGYRVATAGSVREAREVADRSQPDLLISDIGLPDGDGFEVLAHYRQRFPALRAIAVTAHHRSSCPLRGFTRWFMKPLQYSQLLCTIREMLRQPA